MFTSHSPEKLIKKVLFSIADFRWTGTYIVENTLLTNICLARSVGADKTQVLNCMRQQPFTPTIPIPDIKTMSQE